MTQVDVNPFQDGTDEDARDLELVEAARAGSRDAAAGTAPRAGNGTAWSVRAEVPFSRQRRSSCVSAGLEMP